MLSTSFKHKVERLSQRAIGFRFCLPMFILSIQICIAQSEQEILINAAISSGGGVEANDSVMMHIVIGEIVAGWSEEGDVMLTTGIMGTNITVTPTNVEQPGEQPHDVAVYPNPVNQELFVRLSSIPPNVNWDVVVHDMAGREVQRMSSQETGSMPLIKMSCESWSAGSYMLSVSTSDKPRPASFRVLKN